MRSNFHRGLAAATVLTLAVITAALIGTAGASGGASKADHAEAASRPLIMGHRGASGYRPEHTLASYELAARLGADYVEPDLVSTKDGVLAARHENEISGTTDVADHPEFADRRTTKTIDGTEVTGWFTEDFTLAELKTLRAKERLPDIRQRNTIYDGRYRVPTLQQVIDLTRRLSRELGRPIGIIPETKHPTYFRSIGLGLERPLVRILRRNRLAGPRAKVMLQSFETSNLRYLDRHVDVPLVQLTGARGAPYDLVARGDKRTYADLTTPEGLRAVARYADVLGPDKTQIVPRDSAQRSLTPTSLVRDSHRVGLLVVPYTFRNENTFLPAELRFSSDPAAYGNAISEYRRFFALDIDGLFSDNPDTAVEARRGFHRRHARRSARR